VTWEPINLASSNFAQPSDPPSIADLIYASLRHVLSGPPESLKTLIALILALEHVRAGGKVAYVDFEMGPVAVRRMLDDLGATLDEIRAFSYYEPDGPPTLDDLDEIAKAKLTLATIDAAAGAYDASGLDDNKRADAERFAATWVKPFWDRSITTIVLDHVTKNSDSRGKFSIGSERKIGQADVHLGLEAITQLSRGTTGRVRITTHKDRPGHLPRPTAAELELRSDPDTHKITWTFRPPAGAAAPSGDTWRPTVLMEREVAHVGRYDYEPASRTALVDAVPGKREWLFQPSTS
jgi:AAA domain